MNTLPCLKTDIQISPWAQSSKSSAEKKFLLEIGQQNFLITEKVHALILALQTNPENATELESAFAKHSGSHYPADVLIQMCQQVLPSALLRDTPLQKPELPFTISTTVLTTRVTSAISKKLTWLFMPQVMLSLGLLFAIIHIATLPAAMHAVHARWDAGTGVQLFTLLLLSGLLHEFGHLTASRYFQCPHGAIGFGLYFIFPGWYADVSKAWRLSGKQRAIIDIGGVYFQAILLIFIDAFALASGNDFLLKLSWLITFTMLFTLNPVFKFDGYWLLTDLSGLHNLHRQVRSLIAEMIVQPLRSGINLQKKRLLAIYALLSCSYFGYFGYFLARELVSALHTFPTNIAGKLAAWEQAQPNLQENGLAILQLLGGIAWPLVLLSASFFFLNRLRKSITDIGQEVALAKTSRS